VSPGRARTGAGSGCRPHLIYVKRRPDVVDGGPECDLLRVSRLPCSWSTVHGAVVALSLKAGPNSIYNSIYIKAPGFTTSDAADIDALDVQPSGAGAPLFEKSAQGGPPTVPIGLVTPVVNWN
jgi:hypothetical protein